MKILTTSQIREADAYTIGHEPISSIDLMERAAQACLRCVADHYVPGTRFMIFCGPGNNGGDGLALCRLLRQTGFEANAICIDPGRPVAPDNLINRQRLQDAYPGSLSVVKELTEMPDIPTAAVLIDALLGTGLSRPPEDLIQDTVHHINASGMEVVALDLPTGLFADTTSTSHQKDIVKANRTFCFQAPRLAFMMPENDPFIGDWHVLDIGISASFLENLPCKLHYMRGVEAASLVRVRKKFSHKGDFGHSLLVAGGYGKTGAAILAARGCLRAGTGLLTVHLPRCCNDALQASVPEAMTQPDSNDHCVADTMSLDRYSALGAGPGLGTAAETQQALKLIIQQWNKPLVLDADALNILSENPTWLSFLPAGSILTPHPGELKRLTENSEEKDKTGSDDFERFKRAVNFAVKHRVYLVLKGAHTATITPMGETYFNSTGNPGMAKGGSGDVLTGIITGLVAQGYDSLQASVLGVYVHGLAGDLAAADKGTTSMITTDLVDRLPEAFRHLEQTKA